MMHNCKGSIFILFFRFLLCLLACGCSDDTDMPGTPAGTDRVTACVRFSVRVAGGLGLYTAAGDGYDEVIGQFARQAEGIAMTGKAADAVTVSAGTDVNIDLTASPVALERLVAKVLLVCDTYTDDGRMYGCPIMRLVRRMLRAGFVCRKCGMPSIR